MELGSGITLAEQNGCLKTVEVPVNYVEFAEPENEGASCLDLLKDLGNSGAVRGPERLFCNIDPFERWGRFPASVLRNTTRSSSQFGFASGNGSYQQASQFTRKMQMNDEGISQPGSQCMNSFYWVDHGVSRSETMVQFTPITPDKNKPVVDNRQTDVNGSEEGVTNKRIRQELNLSGTNFIHHYPAYMFCGEPSLSLGSQIPQNVDFQVTGNNTNMDLSAPVTPDKWKTVQKISTRKDDDLFCQEKLEGNGQKTNQEIIDVTSEIVLEPSSQQESEKQIVGESLDANQENTPRQKTKRRKHRPKVVIEGKPAKQQKQMTPNPVSTPENPRVKRKYVRKEKKNLPETSAGLGGEHASSKSVQQSAKRVLNFDVQEAQFESIHKDPGAGSECNVDAQHRPSNGSNVHNANAANGSKYDMLTQHKQSDDCAIPFAPPNVFGTSERTADPSEKIASDAGHPVNKVVDELRSQGYSIRIIPPSRRNMLRENLKELARDRDNQELQRMAGGFLDQGITKNKRSKRDRISPTTDTKRRFEMWNGYGRLPNGGACNGRYILPATFIPEQCKRKRTKAAASEQAPNVAPNVSSSPVPSLSNQASSLDSGQKMVTCPPSEYAERNNQAGLKIKFTMSSQAQKQDLIAQANVACFRQIPIMPRSTIICYRTPVFDEQRAVTEVTTPKPPRKRRTKKGQIPEANVIPLHPPTRKDRVYESPSMLHSAYFSQTNILELVEFLIQRLLRLNINALPEEIVPSSLEQENAIVPYNGNGAMVPFNNLSITPKKKKPRAKVDLDNETNRVWLLLMGMPSLNAPDGTDAEKEKWWEEERRVFHGRAESFIARMHLVQGDRRFSPWKGSVVDSVVGVFLTQNVSDHLSSSAYMNLAARFPVTRNVAHDEVKVSPEKEDSYLVEFDEYVKDEEKVSRCPVTSQDTSVVILEDDGNTEEKDILHDTVLDGEDRRSGTVACSDSLVEIPIAQITTEGTNLEACITSLESTFSGLNSIASSQNSSDSPIQASNSTSVPLQLHRDQSLLPNPKTWYGLSASTSFTELLHLARRNMLHLASDFVADEKKETMADHICKPDACLSIGGDDSDLHQQQNVSEQVSCVSSTTNIYNGEYHETGLQDAKVLVETQSASAIRGVTEKWNFETSCIGSVTERTNEATCQEASVTQSTSSCDSHTKITSHFDGSQGEIRSEQQSCNRCSPPAPFDRRTAGFQQIYSSKDFPVMNSKDSSMQVPSSEAHEIDATQANMCPLSCASDGSKSSCTTRPEEKMSTTLVSNTKDDNLHIEISNAGRPRRKRVEKVASEPIDWDLLRRHACYGTVKKERSKETMDSIDWEAIRRADVSEISDAIRERGMNNRLAQRIKEFLDRVVKDHGSIDLEWLRDVPPDKVKDYLLSIKGLGLKSVECVRLLTLHHLAFPVDTNVGRICVRLGWVPLQPLPESLQLHLLELYPILETIQKYLWPRLCKLDQRTLYELHYQMITFGKVFCTKSKPNCNACPMRGECRHFASAFASARLALPGPEEKGLVVSTAPVTSTHEPQPNVMPMPLPQLEHNPLREEHVQSNREPIIEEPASPEPECLEAPPAEIEDFYYEDPDEIPTIKLNIEKFTENLQNIMQQNNMELQEADISKALVALTPEAASIPQPKLKNVSRLRTEHLVYELPDSHPLAEGLDQREPDDPSPYLLAIWSPGETAQSTELPEASCSFRGTGVLCDMETCSACNSIRETRSQIVRGTLLIPCRTAMRGSFPLNGTYFQVNEVFADHSSSLNPINIPRQWIWNLARRTVYFGTSVPTIFKGLTTETIQQCFWRGFVCVRGFDRETRAPRPLMARLHFPASKALKNKKATMQEKQGQ